MMATCQLNDVVRHLRHAAKRRDSELSGGALLEGFLATRDGTAFEALVRRHGPTVLGFCNRVLGCPQDTEDAFQATFLVLAQRASSIKARDAVGNWLYGVAFRAAREARAAARRWAKEKQMSRTAAPTQELNRN